MRPERGDYMAKLLNQLPLFSLVQLSPYLYGRMMEKVKSKSPVLIKKIKEVNAERLESAAHENGVIFVKPRKGPVIATATVLSVLQAEMFGVITLEITFPLYGEVWRARETTRKILGLNGFLGNNGKKGSGIIVNVTLSEGDTPILVSKSGQNGRAQKFFKARKEL